MSEIRKFIQWLSFHPSSDDIARSIVTEYLQECSAMGVRFSRLQADESIIVLGQFGLKIQLYGLIELSLAANGVRGIQSLRRC